MWALRMVTRSMYPPLFPPMLLPPPTPPGPSVRCVPHRGELGGVARGERGDASGDVSGDVIGDVCGDVCGDSGLLNACVGAAPTAVRSIRGTVGAASNARAVSTSPAVVEGDIAATAVVGSEASAERFITRIAAAPS